MEKCSYNMIDSIKNSWQNFADKHPGASKWIREGGLFVIVSNLITVLKYLLLLFLPMAFAGLPKIDFGFPGIDITLFGETFKWNIIGYDAQHGGFPYFCAYMVAMVLGECINFPIQRNFVFRSKGKVGYQAFWYLIAFCIVTCIVNSINCIWGCGSRNVCIGLAVQYRNNCIKWRCVDGCLLLCE